MTSPRESFIQISACPALRTRIDWSKQLAWIDSSFAFFFFAPSLDLFQDPRPGACRLCFASHFKLSDETRELIGERTIEYYSKAIAYLNGVVGDQPLAALDNPEARDLVTRMKSETEPHGSKRFGDSGKTIVEYFRVFRTVIASARDEMLKPLYPREWDLAYIGLPKVNKRKQHRPTLSGREMTHIVANAKGKYKVGCALLAGCDVRISELLALRIEKHISDDQNTLFAQIASRSRAGIAMPFEFFDHTPIQERMQDY